MKQFGKILKFELKNYMKNKVFVGVTVLLVVIIAVVMFMPRILNQSGDESDDKSIEIVKSTFMKLNSEHIRFVMDRFKENTTEIRNIKQYLLASIYNAPYTIDAHYDALVRHDMATGKI